MSSTKSKIEFRSETFCWRKISKRRGNIARVVAKSILWYPADVCEYYKCAAIDSDGMLSN